MNTLESFQAKALAFQWSEVDKPRIRASFAAESISRAWRYGAPPVLPIRPKRLKKRKPIFAVVATLITDDATDEPEEAGSGPRYRCRAATARPA